MDTFCSADGIKRLGQCPLTLFSHTLKLEDAAPPASGSAGSVAKQQPKAKRKRDAGVYDLFVTNSTNPSLHRLRPASHSKDSKVLASMDSLVKESKNSLFVSNLDAQDHTIAGLFSKEFAVLSEEANRVRTPHLNSRAAASSHHRVLPSFRCLTRCSERLTMLTQRIEMRSKKVTLKRYAIRGL
jgi:hypothetical protein